MYIQEDFPRDYVNNYISFQNNNYVTWDFNFYEDMYNWRSKSITLNLGTYV